MAVENPKPVLDLSPKGLSEAVNLIPADKWSSFGDLLPFGVGRRGGPVRVMYVEGVQTRVETPHGVLIIALERHSPTVNENPLSITGMAFSGGVKLSVQVEGSEEEPIRISDDERGSIAQVLERILRQKVKRGTATRTALESFLNRDG